MLACIIIIIVCF